MQSSQTIHAAFEVARCHPKRVGRWLDESNFLVVLSTEDEHSLRELSSRLTNSGFDVVEFTEPDLGGELTAFAVVPHRRASQALSQLPLAFRDYDRGCPKKKREGKLRSTHRAAMRDARESHGEGSQPPVPPRESASLGSLLRWFESILSHFWSPVSKTVASLRRLS